MNNLKKLWKLIRFPIKVFFVGAFLFWLNHAAAIWIAQQDPEKNCLGWVCHKVQCPDEYAVWIPEKNGFLPCKNFDAYIETKDVMLLVGYEDDGYE